MEKELRGKPGEVSGGKQDKERRPEKESVEQPRNGDETRERQQSRETGLVMPEQLRGKMKTGDCRE